MNTQSKHTPDKFVCFLTDGKEIYDAKLFTETEFLQANIKAYSETDSNFEWFIAGNARLIAAAPELLEFAKAWVDFRNGNEDITTQQLWAMANTAITKAEGRE